MKVIGMIMVNVVDMKHVLKLKGLATPKTVIWT